MKVDVAASLLGSDFFWVVFAAVSGWVIAGVLGWITWRAAHPKRLIVYGLFANEPPSEQHGPTLAPSSRGRTKPRPLAAPRVLVIAISLLGRQDIGTGDFDRLGKSTPQPLRIDVGLPIVRILKVKKLNNARWPDPRIDGTALAIGPGLIGHNSSMVVQVLVDGHDPALTCPNFPLKDVKEELREPFDAREMYANVMLSGWP
ncbi:hypothetical protein [Streptomyces sp. NPDC002287]